MKATAIDFNIWNTEPQYILSLLPMCNKKFFYLSYYKYIYKYFQNFLIVCFVHNIISSCIEDTKRSNTSLTKAILRDEKADDLVLFNHKVCTSVYISYIHAHTKYELPITGPSVGKIISCNDEQWLNDTTHHRPPTWQACWTVVYHVITA